MIASSAARSSVSVSRRFVSSKRRAFSSATLSSPASVVRSRTSESLNALTRSMFWIEIRPRTSPPTIIGAMSTDMAISPWTDWAAPVSCCHATASRMYRGWRVSSTVVDMAESAIGIGSFGSGSPRSMRVRERDRPGGRVVDADVGDLGIEDLVDLVADQVVHGLHVEVLGEALLDAS